MLINQFKRIGEVIGGEKENFKVFVDSQKDYKKKLFLKVDIDLEQNYSEDNQDFLGLNILEYNIENKYIYLNGTEGGNRTNSSPTINFNWNHLKEASEDLSDLINDPTKILSLEKKIVKAGKKIPENFDKDSIVREFYNWIKLNSKEVRIKIIKYLIKKEKEDFWKSNKEQPTLIIFALKTVKGENEEFTYPGEIEDFVKLYVHFKSGDKTTSSNTNKVCNVCGKSSDKLEPFNFGTYTVDQFCFRIGFYGDNTDYSQFGVCDNCKIKVREGFNYVNKNLKFLAYKNKDDKNIWQYIIPEVENGKLLMKTLMRFKIVSEEKLDQEKTYLESTVNKLKTAIHSANKEKQKFLKKELKEAEKNLSSVDSKVKPLFEDFIVAFIENGITFINLFFVETDLKQTPSSKEVFRLNIVDKTRVQELGIAFNKIKKKYPNFKLWKLKNLVDDKHYLHYLTSLLEKKIIDYNLFNKHSENKLKREFKNKIFELKKEEYFSANIREFIIFTNLFKEAGIFEVN